MDYRMLVLAAMVTFAALAPAGVVSGVVLEHHSGAPLSRSRVRLDRIDVTGRVASATAIAGRSGQFTFSGLAPGLYVLTGMRAGYAPASFGQRRPQGSAPPFEVTQDANVFAELRLRRLGAIAGRVLDENRVGIGRVSVSAFPLLPPFRSVATAESDDRGVYRLHGLAPGKYRVRSAGFRHDDGLAVLPTFSPETLEVKDARVYTARHDTETLDADLSPVPGNLISIAGMVTCAPLNPNPVDVVVSADTGRRQARAGCQTGFRFDNLPPGAYEFFAATADGKLTAYFDRRVEQSTQNAHLELRPAPDIRISMVDEGGRAPVSVSGSVVMRRVDLAGVVETREVQLSAGRAQVILPPGWWEVAGNLPLPNFIDRVFPSWRRGGVARAIAHPDWHEVQIEPHFSGDLNVSIASKAGGVDVRVIDQEKPVPGIPVFLWPVQPDVRRRSQGPRRLDANSKGEVRFVGLAPGEYRVVASFDLDLVDQETVDAAQAPAITLGAGGVVRVAATSYRVEEY